MTTKVKLKDLELIAFETSGTDLDYTLQIERFTDYTADQLFLIKFHATNQPLATLEINGLGQKDLVAGLGELVAGKSYLIMYDGTEFSIIWGWTVGPTTCVDVQNCIEAFTDLDLSNLTTLTLGWNISFAVWWATIDWTNSYSEWTQNFHNWYIANYDSTTVINNNWGIINNNQTVINNEWVTENFDNTSSVNFEGDVHVWGDIIVMNNEVNNWSVVSQSWGSQVYSNLSNVLLCDFALATATPIDPTDLDDVVLIVGWVQAGANKSLAVTSWNPAIYWGPSDLRWNVLTPAIVNAADFGVAFKFGDANYINVTWFNFAVPLTNDILGIKVEVIFDSTSDTVNVDCISVVVFHTDTSSYQAWVLVQEEWSDVAQAKTLNFKGSVTVTETAPWVVDIDITGWTWGITAYDVVSDTMTGVTPVVISDARIQTDTPFNIYFDTQPVGNITRTLAAWSISIVSDNALDVMGFTLVIFGFGNKTTYVQSWTQTLNGAGPWTIVDARISADTPVNLFPLTVPAGFLTIEAQAWSVLITSSATETNLDIRYIGFTEDIANPTWWWSTIYISSPANLAEWAHTITHNLWVTQSDVEYWRYSVKFCWRKSDWVTWRTSDSFSNVVSSWWDWQEHVRTGSASGSASVINRQANTISVLFDDEWWGSTSAYQARIIIIRNR